MKQELQELIKEVSCRALDYSTEDRYLFEKIQEFLIKLDKTLK